MSNSLSSFELFKKLKHGDIYKSINRPIIIADDIRTPENMGSIIRLAANIGAEKNIFISTKALEFKQFKIKKTASGAAEKMDWQIVDDFESAKKLIPPHYIYVAIETSPESENIFQSKLPENIVVIVGNEVKGIREEIINDVNLQFHIPNPGVISSLNVTHALSIALFEWYRQMMERFRG
jgi:23S rRNA (guanosine2251-2'-O)-methyltransferase